MNIAVNTRLLLKNKLEGIGWFTKETLQRITINHPEHNFFFIFDRAFDESYLFSPNVKGIILSPQARHPFLYYLYFEWAIPAFLKKEKIDWVLVQGDTTSTMAGTMAAFYQKVPVGHVEEGLRTYNINSPFPEELNRQVT